MSLPPLSRSLFARYGLAVGAVAAGLGLRLALTAWVGPELPTYITFYPAVMAAALLAGFGPGLVATVLADLVVGYWIMPPVGSFAISSPVDRLSLVLFAGMGLFMSGVAEFYRRSRAKAAAYDQESALRETRRENEFLASLLENADQAFAVGFPDGRLGRHNRAFAALTGYSATELRALDWSVALTPPEWREIEKRKLEELHRTGLPVRYEKEYLRKDGSRVPVELLVHQVRDGRGQPEYYYSFLTDITERRRAEQVERESRERLSQLNAELQAANASLAESRIAALNMMDDAVVARQRAEQASTALRESEDRLRFALETIRTGAWDLDLVEYTAFRSLEHDRIFGYAEALPEWTHEMFLEHVLPEDRAKVDADFRRAIENRADWNFECRIRRRDGQVRWILAAGRHRHDATGAPRRMAGVVQDITARKQAEEALRASERFNVAVLDSLPAHIAVLDRQGTILSVNARWLQFARENGTASAPAVGVGVNYLETCRRASQQGDPLAQAALDGIQAVLDRNQPGFQLEYPCHSPEQERWFLLQVTPIGSKAGRVILSHLDITEQRRAQREREITIEFLRLVNSNNSLHGLIQSAATFFQAQSGCEAVGLRLKEGEDFPYFEARGFPKEFVLMENSLCCRDRAGEITRDSAGHPLIECMCGNVICGRFDPAKPFFTPHGSFWTNGTTQLLASTSEAERQARTRNRCNGEGYESVALLPLHVGAERLGLLQLNDRRPGAFSPETIALWERLADHLAVAVAKLRTDEALAAQARLLDLSNDAILVRDGQDRVTYWNHGAEQAYGYARGEVLGKVAPALLKTVFPEPLEQITEKLRREGHWSGELVHTRKDGAEVTVMSRWALQRDARGQPASVLETNNDITARKRTEDVLRFLSQCGASGSGEGFFPELARYLAQTLEMDFVCIDRLEEGGLSARTLAMFDHGQFQDNVSYTLKDTPCGDVVGQRICCFPRNVRGLFPKDPVLQDLAAESYLGTTLWGAQGQPIGLIAVIGRKALADTRLAEAILQVVAVRAAGELERQLADEALRQSEARYRAIGESIDYGVWVCDANGRNTYASGSFLKLVGQTQEQCSNFGWGELLHPDDTECTIAAWKECARTGGRWDMEHRFRGVDGKYHPILARGVPVRDERGEIVSWVGINLDISRLKQAEQALRELSQRLTYHVDHSPLAVIEWGPDMRLTRWSGEAERIFGWKAGEVLGKQMTDFRWIYPEDQPQVDEVTAGLQTGTAPRRFSANRNYRKNGSVAWCEWYNSSLMDESGKLRSILSLVLDVTSRKLAEQERRKFVLLADHSAEFIGICDLQFKPFYINEAGLRLVGLGSREQAFRTPVKEFFFPEDQRFIYEEFFPRVMREGGGEVEIRFRHFQTGEALWMIHNVFFLKDTDGQPVGLAMVSRDITARKKAEMALAQSAAELARSNEELEQFAYVASHDLQEPLRAVTGYLGLLELRLKGQIDDKGRQHLDGAVQGATRMYALINALLAVSRVSTRGRALASTDLNAVLDHALANLSVSLEETGARVTHDPLPTLRADEGQMAQLFQNLIGNALKFRSDRPPEIHISAQPQPEQAGRWLLAVRDNGIGIEPQYFERIFVIFQRLHTRAQCPGTGIGLAICKKIVERHGGRIWVESQPGAGSMFSFTLADEPSA
jgi:PAS domain S-box-containing protein